MHRFRCQSWQGVGSSAFYFGSSHSSPTKLGYCIENVTTRGLPVLGKKPESLALAGVPALISDGLNCTIDLASRVTVSFWNIHMFVSELSAHSDAWGRLEYLQVFPHRINATAAHRAHLICRWFKASKQFRRPWKRIGAFEFLAGVTVPFSHGCTPWFPWHQRKSPVWKHYERQERFIQRWLDTTRLLKLFSSFVRNCNVI